MFQPGPNDSNSRFNLELIISSLRERHTSLQPPLCNFNTILGSFPVILNASNYPYLWLYILFRTVYSALKYPHRQIRTQSLNQTKPTKTQ